MVAVEHLRWLYGSLVAVDDLSFTARPGEIFGLLGPNGAGKTTCISCMSGLLRPAAGQVSVMGHDMATDGRRARQSLGVAPQQIALYEDLSATENLSYWGGACQMRGGDLRRCIQEVLQLTGLADRAREPVARFSGGMKRRLNFACGIVHRPRVVLLDEPTVGVDPQSRAARPDPRSCAQRRHRHLHYALGGGGIALRPDYHRRSRPHHRAGDAGGAAVAGRAARPGPALRCIPARRCAPCAQR
jgi:ABC-2 type transport system ATP-binding protein